MTPIPTAPATQPPTPQPPGRQQPPEWLQRTSLLLGTENLQRLERTSVLVVGLGGVGSFVAEVLTRSGIGRRVTPVTPVTPCPLQPPTSQVYHFHARRRPPGGPPTSCCRPSLARRGTE